MKKSQFDYQGAKNAGYSDEEITSFLTEQYPNFDYSAAQESGYSSQEINEYLASQKPERSKLQKAGRVASQFGIGLAENALLPYEIAVAPLASKEAQQVPYRENLGEDIENLLMQKQYGNWTPEDEAFLQNLQDQMVDPSKSEEFIQTSDIGVRGLAEKATGLDLNPEGVAEKAASWAGFIKNPKKLMELSKSGVKLPDLVKAISPTGSEALRGLGAGTALEMAEQGQFGPIGTMAAVIAGDLIGGGVSGGLKGAAKLVTEPKKTLANVAASFTSKEKGSPELFHSSLNDILPLKEKNISNGIPMYGSGFYTTDNPKLAEKFASSAREELKKPITYKINEKSKLNLLNVRDKIPKKLKSQISKEFNDYFDSEDLKDIYNKMSIKSGQMQDAGLEHIKWYQNETEKLKKILEKNGYDGVRDNIPIVQNVYFNAYKDLNISEFKENLKTVFPIKSKLDLQKEIIKDFRDAGIQADLGTLTGSDLIKWTQSRLAQSGLTGKALDEFRNELTSQIKNEYKSLADALGEAKYASTHEAGEIAKEGIKKIRESDLQATRELYENASKALKEKAYVNPSRVSAIIKKLEKELTPGSIKSTDQQTVLKQLEKLKQDIHDSSGSVMSANVKDLMNNKIALNDIINYEVQGGTKQLLKSVVSELDRAIISHGKENPTFAKNYIQANKRFSEHAKTFRNKNVDQILRATDPSQLINKMNNVQGIRNLSSVLSKTNEGKEIFNNLKRLKLDKVIGDNLVDSTTQQVKLGTFSKLLEKGKNREIVKELLGPQAYKRLEKLQKNAGRLADASQKFYNASKSGAVAADAAVIAKALFDIASALMGNPWPLVNTVGGVVATRKLSNLLADPTFLKLTEEVILASEKGTPEHLIQSVEQLRPYILQFSQQSNEN